MPAFRVIKIETERIKIETTGVLFVPNRNGRISNTCTRNVRQFSRRLVWECFFKRFGAVPTAIETLHKPSRFGENYRL